MSDTFGDFMIGEAVARDKEFSAKREEVARLKSQAALTDLYKLVQDGDLVRNITKDDDFVYFMHQGVRITNAIGATQAALALVEKK